MEVDRTDKRKRKTASLFEILENTYAVEPFPSQEMIIELSASLGLSDQQVKMWFHHRRLKDQMTTFESFDASTMAAGEAGYEPVSGFPYNLQVVNRPGVGIPSYANDGLFTRQYDQLPWTVQQSRAVAAVEAQLGGPLLADGPILGFEFDPLPPGAFHAPIEPAVHCNPGGLSYMAERRDRPHGGPIKVGNWTSLQCQFTQGEPSSGAAPYRQYVPSRYYRSPAEVQGTWIGGSSYVHSTQLPTSGFLRPQVRQSHMSRALGSHSVPHSLPQSSSRFNRRVDANFGGCSIIEEENPFMPSETQAIHDDRLFERNWKAEKMRLKEEMRQKKQAARLKIVNETLELIEDKQLELIELAYFIRILRSISALDIEIPQRLRSFGDMCGEFSPKSVCLKKPFRVQPWIDSDKNVSTLLMVWRFLICFADALSLSPFTIDEFVQALCDTQCIPKDSFESGWSKKHLKNLGFKANRYFFLKRSPSLILALLDGAIKKALLGACETCRDLERIPCTTSALALRLVELDASLCYTQQDEDC